MTTALAPRWKGQAGRTEVWYATLTDAATATGAWIHHELVAPLSGDPYVHGWAAVFPPGEAPLLERFGPSGSASGFASTPEAALTPPRMTGRSGSLAWDVSWAEDAGVERGPLFTFPRWAWRRELLPAAQVVPVASAPFSGRLEVAGRRIELSPGTHGGLAHIYGHGNADRWAWLHADLGGGDVLEVVSAVSRRPPLDRLPPLAFVQLRLGGRDWPRDPLAAAPTFRSHLFLPEWSLRGGGARRRLRVEVTIPPERSVRVAYTDPDGARATCTNSEIADADVVLERRAGRRWALERSWRLTGCAHSEIGTRP